MQEKAPMSGTNTHSLLSLSVVCKTPPCKPFCFSAIPPMFLDIEQINLIVEISAFLVKLCAPKYAPGYTAFSRVNN